MQLWESRVRTCMVFSTSGLGATREQVATGGCLSCDSSGDGSILHIYCAVSVWPCIDSAGLRAWTLLSHNKQRNAARVGLSSALHSCPTWAAGPPKCPHWS